MEKTLNLTTRITFTPPAHAVLAGLRAELTPHHRLCIHGSLGDLVDLAGCQSTFVIIARMWQVSPTDETLEIVLDLMGDPQPLRVVI